MLLAMAYIKISAHHTTKSSAQQRECPMFSSTVPNKEIRAFVPQTMVTYDTNGVKELKARRNIFNIAQ